MKTLIKRYAAHEHARFMKHPYLWSIAIAAYGAYYVHVVIESKRAMAALEEELSSYDSL